MGSRALVSTPKGCTAPLLRGAQHPQTRGGCCVPGLGPVTWTARLVQKVSRLVKATPVSWICAASDSISPLKLFFILFFFPFFFFLTFPLYFFSFVFNFFLFPLNAMLPHPRALTEPLLSPAKKWREKAHFQPPLLEREEQKFAP